MVGVVNTVVKGSLGAVVGGLSSVEGHEEMVDDHREVVAAQQQVDKDVVTTRPTQLPIYCLYIHGVHGLVGSQTLMKSCMK